MTAMQALLAFTAAAAILTVTPGLDTALVLRSVSAGGPRSAGLAAIGIALGCLAWGAIVSLGLGALLAASTVAFMILKWMGAAYLFYLGFRLLLAPRHRFDCPRPGVEKISPWQSLRQGFLTNMLNPKVGVFYVTFLPQFVPAGADVMTFSFLLAAIHVALGLAWFTLLIAATLPIAQLLRRPSAVRFMDRLTGAIFLAFGVRLVLAR